MTRPLLPCPLASGLGHNATVQELVRLALDEDIGRGDVTTEATVSPMATATAEIRQKEAGVLCGLPLVDLVFSTLDPGVRVTPLADEGSWGDRRAVARLEGPARVILTGERTALNFLQRLSGVATASRRAAELVAGTGVSVLDTRKTTPGHRVLEKYAVRIGGCRNHRDGLRAAVARAAGRVRLEASGGVTLDTLAAVARTGVDYVSLGALTHSARAIDFSLEIL